MRTSKDHRINICITHGFKIIFYDLFCHNMFFEPFLNQWHKKWTCFLNHFNLRIHSLNHFRIHSTLNRCFSTYHTDFPIRCSFYCCSRSRNDYSYNRKIKLILHCIQCKCTRCITCDHNCFHLFRPQETDNLF